MHEKGRYDILLLLVGLDEALGDDDIAGESWLSGEAKGASTGGTDNPVKEELSESLSFFSLFIFLSERQMDSQLRMTRMITNLQLKVNEWCPRVFGYDFEWNETKEMEKSIHVHQLLTEFWLLSYIRMSIWTDISQVRYRT